MFTQWIQDRSAPGAAQEDVDEDSAELDGNFGVSDGRRIAADGVVNLKTGLPSAPGKNVAILDANVYMVSAADVFTSGRYPYPLP